jgi:hypothetical protein
MMRIVALMWLGAIVLVAAPVWSQADNSQSQQSSPESSEDRMVTPPPVSVEAYPTTYAAESRSNYVRGRLTFSPGYSDNVFDGSGRPLSDVSYSVWPSITLDETRSNFHGLMSYAPGFTLYQRTSGLNQANQNLRLDLQYRLSPHVTLGVVDSFLKSSNILDQQSLSSSIGVSGSVQTQSQTIIAPYANQINNTGSVQLTYQFQPNATIGASGTFTNLHYPNPSQVSGLFDSSSKSGSLFYTHRLSRKHYLGATYQYQDLLAFPSGFQAETQTHSVFLFYTAYINPTFLVSVFGGPQYYDTQQTSLRPSNTFSPAAGASLSWQDRQTSVSIAYSRMIASGGGLIGSVHQDAANASLKRQLTRMLSVAVAGGYTDSRLLDPIFFFNVFNTGGHTFSGTVSIERQWGEHLSTGIGYTRLHQTYTGVESISSAPDVNREWVSISYQFSRPLGR